MPEAAVTEVPVLTCENNISFTQMPKCIKGTGLPDGFRYFLDVLIDVGINKRRWIGLGLNKRHRWFLNF